MAVQAPGLSMPWFVVGLLVWIFLTGCGSTDGDQSPAAHTPTEVEPASVEPVAVSETRDREQNQSQPLLPVTITDHSGREVTVASVDRIIPLEGSVAEIVFALGLGQNVVATDLSATFPVEADQLPEIGYQRALAAEPIATFSPTVLLATDVAGPEETLNDLRALGYPVVIVPNESTPDGPAGKVRAIANALGVPERGQKLAAEIESAIAANSAKMAGAQRPKVLAMYVRGTSAQLVLGQASSTHWLIEAAGGTDLADELGVTESAPISAEAVLGAEPDVLLIPAAGLASVGGIDGLLEIGGLSQTPAGRNRRVISFDDQLLLGNGPRVGQLIADLRSQLQTAEIKTAETETIETPTD